MPAWVIWLIAAGVLAIAEVLSLDLVLIMCALAAVAAAVAAGLGASAGVQFAVFAASALGLLLLARPAARRHLERSPQVHTGTDALVGRTALVLETVDHDHGLVKLHGETWTARPYDPTQVIEVGRTVNVMEIKGATALVWGEP